MIVISQLLNRVSFASHILLLLLFMLLSVQTVYGGGDEAGKGLEKVAFGSGSGNGDTPFPDLFTGTMSYSIPIPVLPGRNGMDPDLALLYRSSGSNGWVGVGWDLEVGAIERSTRFGVDYDKEDFLLRTNGSAQEMVTVVGTNEFHAKIEGEFLKITKLTNPDAGWLVINKKGQRFYFGETIASRQYDVAHQERVFKWYLNKIEDTNGNVINYSYTALSNGQRYLSEITYQDVTVKFNLEARADKPKSYRTKFSVITDQRLKSIEVYSGQNLQMKYELHYEDTNAPGEQYSLSTGRSLLASVTHVGSDGTSKLQPTRFAYSTGSDGWNSPFWGDGPAPAVPIGGQCRSGDFNGDGKADIACYTNANGVWYVALSTGSNWDVQEWNNGPSPAAPIGNQCMTGDFNGDGKTDIACYTNSGGDWHVALSTGSGWNAQTWGAGPSGIQVGSQCLAGDFSGDGKTDIACYSTPTGSWHVAISPETGTIWSSTFWYAGPTPELPIGNQCITGDFNGDGKTDVVCYANANGVWHMALSTGSSWDSSFWYNGSWPAKPATNQCMPGDFNGDGKTDIACYTNGNGVWEVTLSTGAGWDKETWYTGPWPASAGSQCMPADFNGDGKTDIACYTNTGGDWHMAISTGHGWKGSHWVDGPGPGSPVGNRCTAGDFNGDGKTDIACYSTYPGSWHVGLSNSFPTDYVKSITSGIGGVVRPSFSPSTIYDNLNLPFAVQVLSALTVESSGTSSSTTNFAYAKGYFHIGERDFRGFNRVSVSAPEGPNGERTVSTTWFHQGEETGIVSETSSDEELKTRAAATTGYMKGRPYRTRISDNSSKVYSETETTYRATPDPILTPYYFNPPEQVDSYVCDGSATSACKDSGSARKSKVAYTHDTYGNVTREDRYGDIANHANHLLNMTVVRTFQPNVSGWLVGFPKSETVYQGIGETDSGTNLKIRQSCFYYDGDLATGDCTATPTGNQQPTKGNLTRVVRWLNSTPASFVESRTAYDAYGNPVSSRDPNGNVTTIGFDASYTFPTSSTNAKSQTATSTFYGVGTATDKGLYGQPRTVTDPNSSTATFEYDLFGRKTKEIQPGGFWSQTAYNSFGTVGSQHTRSDNQLGLWSAAYFDGLGRTFKLRKSGPDNNVIVTETAYDQRGLTSRVSLPYFEGKETPLYRTFTYDVLGRATRSDSPDGTFTLACYSDLVSVRIDENGHRRRETKDPLGRLLKVQEYEGTYSACDTAEGTPYASTTYRYDVLGGLTGVTDANQKETTIVYDSLGRKTYMIDPDMGRWDYTYYPDGTLYAIKDANHQTDGKLITFDIDELNRVIRKSYPAGSGMTDVVYTYDETDASNAKGRLTTMTDGSGSTKYHYDPLGRAVKSVKRVDSVDYTIEKAFDGLGRLDNITYPDGESIDYYYDAGGNLTEVSGYAEYDEYNALGQPGKLYYGNGIVTSYWYHPKNYRLFAMKTDRLQSALLYKTYGYDKKGNVTAINDLAGPTVPHNIANGNVGYTLDPNRAHAVQTASTTPARVFLYDPNGNMTTDGIKSVAYTPDNLPTTITMGGNTTAFTYDGSGSRVKKTSPSGTRIYLGKLYECLNGSCGNYIYAGSTRIARSSTTDTIYYHGDHLGSTALATDDSGNQVESIHYYPFGETRQDSGPTNMIHKYTGQEQDYEVGLYNYNARLYDPEMGRFVSADTVVPNPANPQSLNRYSYVQNNPLAYVDPDGHWVVEAIVGAVVGAVSAGIQSDWDLETTLIGAGIGAISGGVGGYVSSTVGSAITYSGIAGGVGPPTASAVAAGSMGGGIAGGMAGGAAAGGLYAAAYGNNVGEGMLTGAVFGGIGGAAYGGIGAYYGTSWGYGRVLANAVAGGTLSSMSGGRFEYGFAFSGATSLAMIGWEYARQDTNKSSLSSERGLKVYDSTVELRTDGTRVCVGCNDNNMNWFTNFGMSQQGGTHNYDPESGVGRFINLVSKPHDFFNSWGYVNGDYVAGGQLYNSAFQAYSMTGMLPAAIFTGLAMSAPSYQPMIYQYR